MRSVLCIVLAAAALAGCTKGSGTGDDDDDIPASCGNKTPDPGEQCDDGNDNRFDGCRPDCTAVDPLMPTAMTWQYFEIPGTKCNDGSVAGFSVNYNPASTKLVVYLPATGDFKRHDLTTGKPDGGKKLGVASVRAIALGHASAGPLLVTNADGGRLFDLDSLDELTIPPGENPDFDGRPPNRPRLLPLPDFGVSAAGNASAL